MQSWTDPHLTEAAFCPKEFIKIELNSVRRPQKAGRYKLIFLLSVSGHHSKQTRMVNGRVCSEEVETWKMQLRKKCPN